MPAFNDLLSGISPETGYPEDFTTLAQTAYDQDFVASEAKIVDLQSQLSAVQAENQALKVNLYDLMANGSAVADPESEAEEPSDDPEDFDQLMSEDDDKDNQ